MPLPWQIMTVEAPGGHTEGHVIPVMDIAPHELAGGSCRCRPVEDAEQPDCWSHHAFDERESYADGRALH